MLVITWHLLTSLNMVLTHMHCTARDKPPQLSACKLPELSRVKTALSSLRLFPFFFFFFAATLTYDTLRFVEFEDFPETSEPVWILGKEYNALTGGTWIFSHENFNTYETHHKVSHSVLSLWCGYVVICRCLYWLVEKDEILSDVTSRLWFTYRKNFPPIGQFWSS